MTPKARAFLDDLRALCQRHQVKLMVNDMYGCVDIERLAPGESPIEEYTFWEDCLGDALPPRVEHA